MSRDYTLADIDFLVSVSGQLLLTQLATENLSDENLLRLIPQLRQDYTPQQTSAAIDTVRLRQRAVGKFGEQAYSMLFTEAALEQASDPFVRMWRAGQYSGAIVDACCGIGADSLAFAQAGNVVTGIDLDPVRVALARYNADVLGVDGRFLVDDVTTMALPAGDVLFFDPARRDARGNRIYDVERYLPPLSWIKRGAVAYEQVVVKLSPGVDTMQLQDYNGRLAFVSVEGDLKEAQFTIGEGVGDEVLAVRLSAEMPPQIYQVVRGGVDEKPLSAPRRWLCEPDPAIIRAGYVAELAAELGGTRLDETIAYFTTDVMPESVWVRAWEIVDWMPFQLKRLRAGLRERGIGRLTVKKRGSPITPESLIRQLKLKGDLSATVVLTQYEGQPIVLICKDYSAKSA